MVGRQPGIIELEIVKSTLSSKLLLSASNMHCSCISVECHSLTVHWTLRQEVSVFLNMEMDAK